MTAIRIVSLSVLALALGVRFYAAWHTVAICTWDDSMHREEAVGSPLSVGEVARLIALPTTVNTIAEKTMGYHLWLVGGLRIFGTLGVADGTAGCSASVDEERTWQAVNIVLLLIQLGCVYAIARWATGSFGIEAATLYLLMPVVFGFNRWVMTENHFMAALWVAIAATLWLVNRPGVPTAIGAALAIGVFSNTREYALPFLVLLSAVAVAALLTDGHRRAALVFALLVGPYLGGAILAALPRAFEQARIKFFWAPGWHPLPAWFVHCFWESWGPVLTVLAIVGLPAVVVRAWRRRGELERNGITVLWAALGCLTILCCVGCVISSQRTVRPSILPFFFLLAFLLVSVRVLRIPTRVTPAIAAAVIGAIGLAAAFEVNHWFLRFERGTTYVAFGDPVECPQATLECVDHPLWIRGLSMRFDRHFLRPGEIEAKMEQER